MANCCANHINEYIIDGKYFLFPSQRICLYLLLSSCDHWGKVFLNNALFIKHVMSIHEFDVGFTPIILVLHFNIICKFKMSVKLEMLSVSYG